MNLKRHNGLSRRAVLLATTTAALGPLLSVRRGEAAIPRLRINGEVSRRSDALLPPERCVNGTIDVPDRPCFGVELNEAVIRARSLPL